LAARHGFETTRVMSEDEILNFASGLPYRTSCHLNWSGVEVHRYRLTSHGTTRQHEYPHLVVMVYHHDSPEKAEVRVAGEPVIVQFEKGCVSIVPPGVPVSAHRLEEHDGTRDAKIFEATAIFIDPFIFAEIAQANNGIANLEILPQIVIRDSLIWEIGLALEKALASVPPVPAIYAESLAATLATHILIKYTKPSSSRVRSATLNNAQLRRSIEFIHDNLHRNLTLEEIAAIANMSKYHFAKSFRQAMGMAPHKYMVDLRVAKARKLLTLEKSMTLAEVANVVGYSDKSHFIAQFFKVVGTTPHQYRKQL
jgi:AraC family transcriptional regulator